MYKMSNDKNVYDLKIIARASEEKYFSKECVRTFTEYVHLCYCRQHRRAPCRPINELNKLIFPSFHKSIVIHSLSKKVGTFTHIVYLLLSSVF